MGGGLGKIDQNASVWKFVSFFLCFSFFFLNTPVDSLSHANINDDGAERIASLMVNSPNLKEIEFCFFLFCSFLFFSFLFFSFLINLVSLGWNSIGDEGCKCIAAALASNTTLCELRLNRNHIGKAGANALANALNRNITLVGLEFVQFLFFPSFPGLFLSSISPSLKIVCIGMRLEQKEQTA